MKKAIFGLALAAITFACASEPKASVADEATPGAECATECETACEAKTECSEAKTECSEAKVCPVTGKEIN